MDNSTEEREKIFNDIRYINQSRYDGDIKYLAISNEERNRLLVNIKLNIDDDLLAEADIIYNKYINEAQKYREKYLIRFYELAQYIAGTSDMPG